MGGIVLVLHFGLFEILALAWQRSGINAQPLMCQPLRAVSLKEFWSRRWNTAFNQLVHSLALRPLSRRFGMIGGIVGVFLISGLVHEAVISLPARTGYGLPTAYFLLQGLGVVFERSGAGRRLGLGRGIRGWLFMGLVTAGPAIWLFHAGFVRNVILPMIDAFKK
jgi:alginate O-acetyltransferase complex protein AlgI